MPWNPELYILNICKAQCSIRNVQCVRNLTCEEFKAFLLAGLGCIGLSDQNLLSFLGDG